MSGSELLGMLMLVLMIGVIHGMLSFLAPIVTDQIRTLLEKAPKYLESLSSQGFGLGSVFDQLRSMMSDMKKDPVGTILRSEGVTD